MSNGRWWVSGIATMALALLLGCGGGEATPEAGASCTNSTEAACSSASTALFCIGGKWTTTPCRGPGGCAVSGTTLTCDQTLGVAGEACFTNTSGTGACAADGKAQLSCQANQFQKVSDCVTCNITSTNQVDCQRPCGPDTCTGCCFNGVCQAGNMTSACGKGGGACSACGGQQICRVDQSCGVNPESRWRVQPVSAVIASSNNGTEWDGDGSAPDARIEMLCPPTSSPVQGMTPTAQNTYTPSWSSGGCITTASALLAGPWTFQPFDEDLASDDPISQPFTYRFEESDFVAGTVTLSAGGGLTSITVQLQRQ